MKLEPYSLGKVKFLQPRSVWPNEAHDFTPWLFENIDYLQEALGIDLELDHAEYPVGDFSLDLFGRDLTNNCALIVENQLERSDHGHLGQLLTYAAGTDAGTVIWVADDFRPEHRDALHFLNDSSSGNTRFFALRIRVLQIGDSAPAPHFEVVVQPSDWSAQLHSAQRSSDSQDAAFFSKFWDEFLTYTKSKYPGFTTRSKNSDRYMSLCSKNGVEVIACAFKKGAARCEVYIGTGNVERNSRIFRYLEGKKDEVESTSGLSFDWDERDGRKTCCVSLSSGLSIIDDRQELIHWLADTAKTMSDTFFPIVDGLPEEVLSGE